MADEQRLTSGNLPLSRVTTDPLERISVDWKLIDCLVIQCLSGLRP